MIASSDKPSPSRIARYDMYFKSQKDSWSAYSDYLASIASYRVFSSGDSVRTLRMVTGVPFFHCLGIYIQSLKNFLFAGVPSTAQAHSPISPDHGVAQLIGRPSNALARV